MGGGHVGCAPPGPHLGELPFLFIGTVFSRGQRGVGFLRWPGLQTEERVFWIAETYERRAGDLIAKLGPDRLPLAAVTILETKAHDRPR